MNGLLLGFIVSDHLSFIMFSYATIKYGVPQSTIQTCTVQTFKRFLFSDEENLLTLLFNNVLLRMVLQFGQ